MNSENSAKPWNRYSHFSQFISPKTNETISLKDHRFNRLNDCCLVVLYHFDDIAEYLSKFEHVTNNIAILDRSFVDMGDVLKPVFCATALLGHHIMRPFQRLLVDKHTSYETLMEAFPKLHKELTETEPKSMLTPDQVFKFVSSEIFSDTVAKTHLISYLFDCCKEFEEEVVKILKICLQKFKKGFEKQKGAIFGFGNTAGEDTGKILKISSLPDRSILADTPVHNLGEERSVGMLNYELNFRGREHFNTSSQNVVVNKSTDLISDSFDKFKKFRKQAIDIKDIKQKWNKKMEELQKEGLSSQEAVSLTEESKKMRDLEFLKLQNPPGPFTSVDEVDEFMKNTNISESDRNHRLYVEVRFAKASTSKMKKTSSVFRLKNQHKTLDSEDYVHNLRLYFGCVHSVKRISLSDLSYILTGLNAAMNSSSSDEIRSTTNICIENQTSSSESFSEKFKSGSHIAAVWSDEQDPTGQTLTWYIGVIEDLTDTGANVSYLLQTNTNTKSNWMYPETSSTLFTPFDQMIASDLSVEYSCATIIRCRVSSKSVSDIEKTFKEYINRIH